MKILIMRASNTKNYGSLMMVANYISNFNKISQGAEFIVDNVEDGGLERIQNSSGVLNIKSYKELGVELRPDCIGANSIVKLYRYFKYAIYFGGLMKSLGVTRVIQLGGDDFSEYYSIKALMIEYIKIISLSRKGYSVDLVGQTIGPFSSWRLPVSKFVLSKVKIFTRDNKTLQYLNEVLGLKNVELSADLAYLPLPGQGGRSVVEKADEILGVKRGYYTLVPSGLWQAYTDCLDDYIDSWVGLISNLTLSGNKVVILAHVISDTSDDRVVIKLIKDKLDKKSKLDVLFVEDVLPPVLAREIISRSALVISGRMHACVSALQTMVPAIPLSYSVKFQGVIGELLMPTNIIECAGSNNWTGNKIIKKIEGEIEKIKKRNDIEYKALNVASMNSIQFNILNQIK